MKKTIIQIILSIITVVVAIILPYENLKIYIFIVAYLIVGFEIIKKALKTIKNGGFLDENFLMSIASIAAFCIGEQIEAVAIMLFYRIGETFESYSVRKSRKSIKEAMDLAPEFANLKVGKEIKQVSPQSVEIGDIIIIRPGEKVPLDCVITNGTTSLDTSALTGESLPKNVKVGDEILSATLNLNGLIEAKVIKKYEDCTVSKILELVEESSIKKSKSEKFITKFAKFYTPIVVFIAAFLAFIVPIFLGDFTQWLQKGVIFLVVSCPCALVVSVPLSFFGGIGGASKSGILVKGSVFLENLAKLKIIAFDKTGTLTKGEFILKDIVNESHISKDELLCYAATSQIHSTHPIGKSILKAYTTATNLRIDNLQEIAGQGISAIINGKKVLVGNSELLSKFELPNVDKTVCFIAIDDKFAGYLTFEDEIRKDTKSTILWLKSLGIYTAMLSGDKQKIAQNIANELQIDECYAELLPENKVRIFEKLMQKRPKNSTIAYIGDGINDAPVLARSDVGIAMSGTDAAMEAGDVVLLSGEISKLKSAILIAKKTLNIAYQNIVFSIFIKILVMILAVFGIANIWLAIFADVGVTILAILNSFRPFGYARNLNKTDS